jgi:hypothetical protein
VKSNLKTTRRRSQTGSYAPGYVIQLQEVATLPETDV